MERIVEAPVEEQLPELWAAIYGLMMRGDPSSEEIVWFLKYHYRWYAEEHGGEFGHVDPYVHVEEGTKRGGSDSVPLALVHVEGNDANKTEETAHALERMLNRGQTKAVSMSDIADAELGSSYRYGIVIGVCARVHLSRYEKILAEE